MYEIKIDTHCHYDPDNGNIYLGGDDCIKYDVLHILNHEEMHKYLCEIIDHEASVKYHNIQIDHEFWMYHEDEYINEMEERLRFIKRCENYEVIDGIIYFKEDNK